MERKGQKIREKDREREGNGKTQKDKRERKRERVKVESREKIALRARYWSVGVCERQRGKKKTAGVKIIVQERGSQRERESEWVRKSGRKGERV